MRFHRPSFPSILCTAALLLGLFALAVFIPAVGAQESPAGSTWSIQTATEAGPDSRGRFDLEADPGSTTTDQVVIRNLGDETLMLEIYASDAVTTEGGGFDLLPNGTQPTGIGAWAQLDQETVALGPRESTIIPFTVNVPANATPGDHAGGIVAVLTEVGGDGGNRVRVDYRVGVRIYLRVSGELAPQLVVEDLHIDYTQPAGYLGRGEATVTYTVRNTGNMSLVPAERVRIAGPLGVRVAGDTRRELPLVLPGQDYTTTATVSGIVPAFKLKAEVQLEPRMADGTPLTDLSAVTSSLSAWVVPWPQVLLLAVLIAALTVPGRWWRRKQANRTIARAFSALATAPLLERLNADPDRLLVIARRVSADANLTGALASSLDREGLDLVAASDGAPQRVRVPWSTALTSHAEVEAEIRRLVQAADNVIKEAEVAR